MTIKQIHTSKVILFGADLILKIMSSGNIEQLNGINQILDNYNLSFEQIFSICNFLLGLNMLCTFRLERLTSDYKDIKTEYNEIIKNTASLAESFNFDDNPIKMFAFYIYLYRNGFLSDNHYFMYSNNMKDFPLLAGVDVVRGTGVCRSIASMFTDICNEVGMNASNLAVNVSSKNLSKKEPLSPDALTKDPASNFFVKVISLITKYIPIANHLISSVEHNNHIYILDPTNDILMYKGRFNNFVFANNPEATMKQIYLSEITTGLYGQNKINLNYISQRKTFSLPSIDYEEYKKIYVETLTIIKANLDIINDFFVKNHSLYIDIATKAADYPGLIGRILPIPLSTFMLKKSS